MQWGLIIGALVAAPGAGGDLELALTSLEAAYAAQPEPSILLAIADLEEKRPKGCERTLATYRRFFEACTSCASLSHAVARFDEVIARCVIDVGEEAALREKLTIPKAPLPERRAADATRREVVDLMLEARKLDWAEGMRGLVTMAEVGGNAKIGFLNEQRARAWEVLKKRPASAEQVLWVLDRIRQVDEAQHAALVKRLVLAEASRDQAELDRIRQEALEVEVRGSSLVEPNLAPSVGCVANPKREWGTVTIDTVPWSVIFVNGEKLGSTPLTRVPALAGCITIRAVAADGSRPDVVKNLTVRPNKAAVLRLDLSKASEVLRYE